MKVIKDEIYPYQKIEKERQTVRGVVLKDNKVALLKIKTEDIFGIRDHYELPGGGIEKGENKITALERELKEEIGVIIGKANYIDQVAVEYSLLQRRDVATCYYTFVKDFCSNQLTKYEKSIVQAVEWIDIDQAIKIMDQNIKGVASIIYTRDSYLLKKVKNIL